MSLRIHSASTLDEAATWLSEETTETWNVRAVLEALLRGWRERGAYPLTRLLPISLEIVVPPGSIMQDRMMTEQTHITERPQTLIAGGAALEKLLHDLLQYGEATHISLNSDGGRRWLCTSPLRPEHVRLPAGVIDTLVPEFDRFVKSDLAAQVLELASLAKDAPVAPAPPLCPPAMRQRPESSGKTAVCRLASMLDCRWTQRLLCRVCPMAWAVLQAAKA